MDGRTDGLTRRRLGAREKMVLVTDAEEILGNGCRISFNFGINKNGKQLLVYPWRIYRHAQQEWILQSVNCDHIPNSAFSDPGPVLLTHQDAEFPRQGEDGRRPRNHLGRCLACLVCRTELPMLHFPTGTSTRLREPSHS